MPRIGFQSRRIDPLGCQHGVPIERLFAHYRHGSRYQCHYAGTCDALAAQHLRNAFGAIDQNADCYGRQSHSDDYRCQRFVFAVTIVVVFVLRLGRDAHKQQHHNVGGKVGHRVYTIGNHSTTAPHKTGYQFADRQEHIHKKTNPCYFVDGLFARFLLVGFHNFSVNFSRICTNVSISCGSKVSAISSEKRSCAYACMAFICRPLSVR